MIFSMQSLFYKQQTHFYKCSLVWNKRLVLTDQLSNEYCL